MPANTPTEPALHVAGLPVYIGPGALKTSRFVYLGLPGTTDRRMLGVLRPRHDSGWTAIVWHTGEDAGFHPTEAMAATALCRAMLLAGADRLAGAVTTALQ